MTTINIDLQQVEHRIIGSFERITGFILCKDIEPIITSLNLDANPRNSRRSKKVTDPITETIENMPAAFPLMSKGILLGSSKCSNDGHGKYRLTFKDLSLEGILDGGHNSLAIGRAILRKAGASETELNKIKTWDDMKDLWAHYLPQIKGLSTVKNDASLNALIPIEILAPTKPDNAAAVAEFRSQILNICRARNNNSELKAETVANQGGVFDSLKAALPDGIKNNVAWKTNDKGCIDLRLLLALTWISLGVIDLPKGIAAMKGNKAYSSKADVMKQYADLLTHPDVSSKSAGEGSYTTNNKAVLSALSLVPDILKAYDLIYRNFKEGYNENGSLGKIRAVQSKSLTPKGQLKTQHTPFYGEEFKHEIAPDGYLMPIAYSMRALIRKHADGTLSWKMNPVEFYGHKDEEGRLDNLRKVIPTIKGALELAHFDPKKVGQNDTAYANAEREVHVMMLERGII